MINALQIARHLLAKKSLREGMIRVPLDSHGSFILDRDDDAARIGAIMRTDGTDSLGFAHGQFLLDVILSGATAGDKLKDPRRLPRKREHSAPC
jgi:hypothetical protein